MRKMLLEAIREVTTGGRTIELFGVGAFMIVFCSAQLVLGGFVGQLDQGRWHLGAEYFNIAQSLVDGRGFGNPFGEETGPTAWMPPLLSILYASLLFIGGSKAVVTVGAVMLAQLASVVSAVLLFDAGRKALTRRAGYATVALYCLWLALFRYWFVELTSDIWLTALLMTCIVSLFLAEAKWNEGVTAPIRWGVLGGFCALSAPALVLPWAGALLMTAKRDWRAVKRAGLSVGLAAICATPWVVRNAMTLHQLIPTKSNLGYEFYQANVLDADGIYDLSIMATHPYNNFKSRFEYSERGEVEFNRFAAKEFREHFARHPQKFWRRVQNRALAAFLVHQPLLPHGPWFRLLKSAVYVSPVILMGVALVFGRRRAIVAELSLIWGIYLLPYIVVAFYIRYFLPLVPLVVVISVLGLEALNVSWEKFLRQMETP